MDLRKEIAELVAEITGKTHPEEAVLVRLAHAGLELVDVAGGIVRGLDATNMEADLKSLSDELVTAAEAIVAKLLVGRPAMRLTAISAVTFLIPTAVSQLGEKYSGDVEAFRVGYLLPIFKEIESFGHRGVVAFGG